MLHWLIFIAPPQAPSFSYIRTTRESILHYPLKIPICPMEYWVIEIMKGSGTYCFSACMACTTFAIIVVYFKMILPSKAFKSVMPMS